MLFKLLFFISVIPVRTIAGAILRNHLYTVNVDFLISGIVAGEDDVLYFAVIDVTVSCGAIPAVPSICTSVTTGYADHIEYCNGVSESGDLLGAADGHGAKFYDHGDKIELSFDDDLPAGTEICITWKRRDYTSTLSDSTNAYLEIWEIVDGSYHQTQTLITSDRNYVTECFNLSYDIDELKLKNDGPGVDFKVDAISYTLPDCDDDEIYATDDMDPNPMISFSEMSTPCVGGSSTITRTWTATDASGNSASASQIITIIDNDAPHFNEDLPMDMTVDCGAIPAADVLTASDDCGEDCGACPIFGFDNGSYRRGLYLPGTAASNYYEWEGGQADFYLLPGGEARLTGVAVNHDNPCYKWEVDVYFTGAYSWEEWSAMGRTYKAGPGVTGTEYEDWTYWVVDDTRATLTGKDCFDGDLLNLSNKPSDFSMGLQIGLGANDKDDTYGASFWFYYDGTIDGVSVSGNGDFNLEGGCVPVSDVKPVCAIGNTLDGGGYDRAFWFDGLPGFSSPTRYAFSDDGLFETFADGTAHMTGTFYDVNDATCGWDMDIWFQDKSDYDTWTAMGRTYKTGGAPSTLVEDNKEDWIFYILDQSRTSSLSGVGCLAGSNLTLSHRPSDFSMGLQIGLGANAQNGDKGFSCWFDYTGDVNGTAVSGNSDINASGDCFTTDPLCDTVSVDVPVNFTEVSTDCVAGSYTITRTWEATDDCGNMVSHTQTITVEDNDAPVLSMLPSDESYTCNDVPAAPVITATDNCSDSVAVSYNEVQIGTGCNYTLERTWEATDDCGNMVSHMQVITVVDTLAPVLSAMPGDISVDCSAVPSADVVTATDDCDDAVTVNFSEIRLDGDCANRYTLERTWTAMDACGNMVMAMQTINLIDTVAPVLFGAPADVTVSCDAIPEPAVVTATDNCSDNFPVVYCDLGNTSYSGPGCRTMERLWRAIDACGNVTEHVQVITFVDNDAPVLSAYPADIDLLCGEVAPAADTLTATDNCDANVPVTLTETVTATTIVRTWTADDGCGNSVTHTQTINLAVDPEIDAVTIVDATSCEGRDGGLIIDLVDGSAVAPYQVVINGMDLGSFAAEPIDISGAPGGTAINEISITDANGCSVVDLTPYLIGEPSGPSLAVSVEDEDCDAVGGAVEIDLNDDATGPFYVRIDGVVFGPYATEPIRIEGIVPGTLVEIGVRDANGCISLDQSGYTINAASGCDPCPIPGGLGSIVNGRHTADVFWAAAVGGTGEYMLQVRELGSTAWTDILVNDTIKRVGGLEPCTTYEWRVATICVSETSAYSAIETFTTDCVREEGYSYERSIFPNPSKDMTVLYFTSESAMDLQVRVMDLSGRVLFADQQDASLQYSRNLDISQWASGMYLIEWTIDGQIEVDRLSKMD